MGLLRRMGGSALAGGIAAGAMLSLLQALWLTPLILQAERHEADGHPLPGSRPDALESLPGVTEFLPDATEVLSSDVKFLRRAARSVPGNLIVGVGFGLLLSAGFAWRGGNTDARKGLLWGAAGYAAFMLAPALELPPALPGMAQGPVLTRQLWWLGTVAATAAGLGQLAFARGWWKVLGAVLLALPHLVGIPPPLPASPGGPPEALISEFRLAVLISGALFWAVLGSGCGWMWGRMRGQELPGMEK